MVSGWSNPKPDPNLNPTPDSHSPRPRLRDPSPVRVSRYAGRGVGMARPVDVAIVFGRPKLFLEN